MSLNKNIDTYIKSRSQVNFSNKSLQSKDLVDYFNQIDPNKFYVVEGLLHNDNQLHLIPTDVYSHLGKDQNDGYGLKDRSSAELLTKKMNKSALDMDFDLRYITLSGKELKSKVKLTNDGLTHSIDFQD